MAADGREEEQGEGPVHSQDSAHSHHGSARAHLLLSAHQGCAARVRPSRGCLKPPELHPADSGHSQMAR